jgi:hypothetical protein
MGGRRAAVLAATVSLAVAVAASAEPCGRGFGRGHGPTCGCGRGGSAVAAVNGALAPLDAAVRASVEEALADERRTEAAYAAVVAGHGEVRPFSNAVHAEGRHAAHLEATLAARGLAVPRPPAPPAAAAGTVAEACAAAVDGERANVALYDRLLAAGPLPGDVRSAFERNRWASLEHHLPAFERCVARAGGDR